MPFNLFEDRYYNLCEKLEHIVQVWMKKQKIFANCNILVMIIYTIIQRKSKDKESKLIIDIYLIYNPTVIVLFVMENSNNKSKIF